MSTGIPHLPWRDEDARAVPLGAFGLQVTSLLALGGYGVEWVASPGVSDLPPLVPKAPLQEGLRVFLDQLSLDGVDLPPLGLRTLNLAFGSGVAEGRHGKFPFLDGVMPLFRTKWPLPTGLICSVSRLHGDAKGVAQAHRTEDPSRSCLGILIGVTQKSCTTTIPFVHGLLAQAQSLQCLFGKGSDARPDGAACPRDGDGGR